MKIVKQLLQQIFHKIPIVKMLMEVKFHPLIKKLFQVEQQRYQSKILLEVKWQAMKL